jgi:alpha-1,2-mannosyltransferase
MRVGVIPVGVIAVVALLARLVPVLRGGGLTGVLAYDDGVYYSASDALLSGRMPYRDYVLLHPPGITVVLAPFAALGRLAGDPVGMAAGRLAFMLVGTACAVLAWVIARRVSPVAGLTAGLLYAVWQPAAYAERTTLLEPLVNLGLLGALALLPEGASRRRVALAGVVLGLVVAVKAWAIVPFAVLMLWLLLRRGWRDAVAFTAAGAGAASVVCLPFLVAAGPQLVREVVLDQLGRPNNGVPLLGRLASIEGLQLSPGPVGAGLAQLSVAVAAVTLVLVAMLAWRRPATRLWAGLFAAQGAMLMLSPSYFGHYGTFVAPSLALLAGAGTASLVAWSRSRSVALGRLVPVAGLVAVALLTGHVLDHTEGRRVPAGMADQALSGVNCVAADSDAALIAADVLTRDLRHGCPLVVDVTGLTYNQDRGDLGSGPTPTERRRDPEWQRHIGRYFDDSGAVLLDQWRSDGLNGQLLAHLERHDLDLGTRSFQVLVPAA